MVETLKLLRRRDFEMLGTDARRPREEEATSGFPTEPIPALRGLWETFGRKPEGAGDDHLEDMRQRMI